MSARIVTVKPLPGAQFPLDATPDGVIELCAPHISLKKVENGTYASLSTSWLFVTDGDDSLCIQNPFSIMWLDQFELKVELLGGSMAAVALEPLQSINEDGYVDVEIPGELITLIVALRSCFLRFVFVFVTTDNDNLYRGQTRDSQDSSPCCRTARNLFS